MSVMMAEEPMPSTLMDSSSTVGLSPTTVISFVPGCCYELIGVILYDYV